MFTQSLVAQPHTSVGVSALLDENPSFSSAGLSSGPQAQQSFFQLSAVCYYVTGEIARRCNSRLTNLSDLFSDRILLVVGGQRSGALGTFAPEKWAYSNQSFDEIHVNIGHEVYAKSSVAAVAADIVLTICHELVHLYAKANGIRDVSGRGNRYHNKRFAELAKRLELRVERSGQNHIGFQTTGFTARGAALYNDLFELVERELHLLPHAAPLTQSEPQTAPDAAITVVAVRKYVFAQCGCRNGQGRSRTLRMALGWWQDGTIGCGICQQIFTVSPPGDTKTTDAN